MNIPQKWINIFGLIIISILVIDVSILTIKNKRLEERLLNSSPIAQIDPLTPGESVFGFKIKTLDGTEQTFNYDDPEATYLLLIFSTTCPHCLATIEKWRKIREEIDENCYIVGVSIHDVPMTTSYIIEKNIPFYTVTVSDKDFQQNYKIGGVPSTILIANGGNVSKVWSGRLDDDDVEDVIRTENHIKSTLH